ncbi:MAG: ribonuclease P protein subunit [Candidatus Geothermarchaeales archaeon]
MKRRKRENRNLLGLKVRVAWSTNRDLMGLGGTVVDETRDTLLLRAEDGHNVRLQKEVCLLEVQTSHHTVMLDGRSLVGRFERRLSSG